MSGADWRQQEELEEQQYVELMDGKDVDICEFVQGQAHRVDGKTIPRNSSKSFVRGWIAQNAIEDIKRDLL
jgi:hypothetical protein